ncbi:MAG: ribokinase [Rhodospirillales bacterium]|jgi:ribokinase|nr:ribokinase [Rhodospirillales bacterium]
MTAAARPVLVIGSLNMDLVGRCDRLPLPGETIAGTGFATIPGGKGANQAVAAARLGARVFMAGCVGDDAFGASLRAGLAAAGVDTTHVATVPGPTGVALIAVDAAGANQIVVVPGANAATGPGLIDRALAAVPGAPGILLLQHEIPPASVAHAVRAGRAAGWFVLLNPAPARPVPPAVMGGIDLIAPNESEAASLLGAGLRTPREAAAGARALVGAGAKAALITLGAAGAVYADAAGVRTQAPIPVQAVDTTGAGDAFLGALASVLAAGGSVADGTGFATAAAALSVTRPGAQASLPTRDDVAAFIARAGFDFKAV